VTGLAGSPRCHRHTPPSAFVMRLPSTAHEAARSAYLLTWWQRCNCYHVALPCAYLPLPMTADIARYQRGGSHRRKTAHPEKLASRVAHLLRNCPISISYLLGLARAGTITLWTSAAHHVSRANCRHRNCELTIQSSRLQPSIGRMDLPFAVEASFCDVEAQTSKFDIFLRLAFATAYSDFRHPLSRSTASTSLSMMSRSLSVTVVCCSDCIFTAARWSL